MCGQPGVVLIYEKVMESLHHGLPIFNHLPRTPGAPELCPLRPGTLSPGYGSTAMKEYFPAKGLVNWVWVPSIAILSERIFIM